MINQHERTGVYRRRFQSHRFRGWELDCPESVARPDHCRYNALK